MAYLKRKNEYLCPICNENEGIIQISDSRVCEDCMPADFQNNPLYLSSRRIRFMLFDDPEYVRVSGQTIKSQKTVPDAFRSKLIISNEEYSISDEINTQIKTAEHIDIAVSFIFNSGLNLIYESLANKSIKSQIRVLTTAYTGSTEMEALHNLFRLENSSVKMELKTDSGRFHSKGYIFHRPGGKGTLLIGSANLSKSALTTGIECMVRISELDSPDLYSQAVMDFNKLWNNPRFRTVSIYNRSEIEGALDDGKKSVNE